MIARAILLFSICFFFAADASAVSPQLRLQRACADLKHRPEMPVPAVLQTEVQNCQDDFKAYHCEELTQQYPELGKRLRSCEALSLCDGNGGPTSALYGWGRGMVMNTADGISSIAKLAWEKAYQDPRAVLEISRKCDALPTCKRALAEDIPWRRNATDAELRGYSSLRLTSESLVADGLSKISSLSGSAVRCAQDPGQLIPSSGTVEAAKNAALVKMTALADSVGNQTKLAILRYRCMDAKARVNWSVMPAPISWIP